jgi:enoyl-CoA hydratase
VFQHIKTIRKDRVVIATLENPPHAYMNAALIRDLTAFVADVDADRSVGAVILTGAHESRFIAHYDVAEVLDAARRGQRVSARQAGLAVRAVGALSRIPGGRAMLGKTPAAGIIVMQAMHNVMRRMQHSGVAFIAAINGSTMGGGCELAWACDFRLWVSGDYVMGQPEVLYGFPAGAGGTQRLTRLVGTGLALEMLLDGRLIRPEEATQLGLVHDVVPPEDLLDSAMALATRLSRRSRDAVAATKIAVIDGGSLPLEDGLLIEQSQVMSTLTGPSAIRGMEAYMVRLAESGEVPSYEPATYEALYNGRFVDMTAP